VKHGLIRAARVAAFAGILMSTTGIAHANWTGTWDSQHGELRLIQEGERVYGDYANRGYFEGRVSQDGNRLRGTFQYKSRRSRSGYIEFIRSGDSFSGGWSWAKDGTVSHTRGNWSGSFKNGDYPALVYAVGKSEYWADFLRGSNMGLAWVNDGVFQTQQPVFAGESASYDPDTGIQGDEWTGTFDTNYGELRLIQNGRRVFGEYAKRGYFEGCVHDGGLTLRATFQYFSPRRNHGFIEFRSDGDGFMGTWSWTKNGVPASTAKVNWSGARSRPDVPQEVYIRANEMGFADMWSTIDSSQRRWVLGSDYYDSCDPPEVDYEGNEEF